MATGHGTCKEGARPSGERHHERALSWNGTSPQVKIDYSKLRELCLRCNQGPGLHTHPSSAHDDFMATYSSIFTDGYQSPQKTLPSRHNCQPVSEEPSHEVSAHIEVCHDASTKRKRDALTARTESALLQSMATIVTKLPPQRSHTEVQELARCLTQFPGLLPGQPVPDKPVLEGVAARALGENIPPDISLPGHGGVYLILRGSIHWLKNHSDSSQLVAGEYFGAYETKQHPLKSSDYPYYVSLETCVLMRITTVEYERVAQKYQSEAVSERQQLLRLCPLLLGVSPSVLSKLADCISWETAKPNACLIREGDIIERVGFIQTGRCIARALVPGARLHEEVRVGEVGEGACLGEGLLRGVEMQPYTVTAATSVRLGWLPAMALKVNELDKHLLQSQPTALPILSHAPSSHRVYLHFRWEEGAWRRGYTCPIYFMQCELRHMLAKKLMERQWRKIKSDVTRDVAVERGIVHGLGKWKHSMQKKDSAH